MIIGELWLRHHYGLARKEFRRNRLTVFEVGKDFVTPSDDAFRPRSSTVTLITWSASPTAAAPFLATSAAKSADDLPRLECFSRRKRRVNEWLVLRDITQRSWRVVNLGVPLRNRFAARVFGTHSWRDEILCGIAVWGEPDPGAMSQIKTCAQTGDKVALMADHHKGYAVPTGQVVAYRDSISPSGVGYDIVWGNKAVITDVGGPPSISNKSSMTSGRRSVSDWPHQR